MSDQRPTRDSMTIEEAAISNMWEIAAIVELLEQKGFCTKQDLHTIINHQRATPEEPSRTNPCDGLP